MSSKTGKKRARRANTHSIVWRIHGTWLSKILSLFIITDLFIFWLLMPKDLLTSQGMHITQEIALDIYGQMRPILIFQVIYWVFTLMFGSAKLHRMMQPLTRITETARALSQEKMDDEVFHQLESAISQISPLKSDQTLHTGNSELQGLESAVNSLLERMRQTYGQQARFVSDASHELRTPISVIQGYVNMLDRWGKSDPKVLDEAISAIKSEALHMQQLIEQLLFLARSDSGRNPLTVTRFSLSAMVRETLTEYEMIDPQHTWKTAIPPNDIQIQGDEGMIKQTIRIFCDNAIKYSPPSTRITIALRDGLDTVAFSVQDEGIGISPEDQAHVLERFYRADPSRVRETGGNGLGLSIANWIVERHGGKIEILSRLDMGTRMTVVLKK